MRIGNVEHKERISSETAMRFTICVLRMQSSKRGKTTKFRRGLFLKALLFALMVCRVSQKQQQASISHQRMLVFTFLLFRQKQQPANSSHQRMLVFTLFVFRQKPTACMSH